ncbi:gephyrin-like molybdotransferase Glp [Ferruginibacter sp. HRS2-29]|uniref:molybdopterin molybdotransferase MoeA n=1 Tax=Ferruginibacter sp. HRS2-29 TaxID=2487334 RepID=UPI0020CC4F81|nr:gephyrin-like molybdotransferase Glp [Ferruginibacter sp. HRS2-29]MCP9750505.1 molybdopterin molybdenumtransferase MoeA [Ferruginibacter sp. HRS2-29]
MITVTEAKQLIQQHCQPGTPVVLQLQEACGRILAEDIFSKTDIPNYPQSSHDGYAFNHAGYLLHKRLEITGEMAAGENTPLAIEPHQAVRIFTGAPVPPGADTVVMQEKTTVEDHTLILQETGITIGASVRARGAEIKTGELALEKESLLTPAALGFLAGIGITAVKIYPTASATIIITGNELLQPGQPLGYGQVYEANSFSLKAALVAAGITSVDVLHAKDNLAELTFVLKKALTQSDIILLTGGVSVGDYDFVTKAAKECGVEKIFHKIRQKPGKPLYFGKTNNNIVFGLPGNPSSVLTCFYQYVLLALQQMKNIKTAPVKLAAPVSSDISKPAGFTHFLKGYYNGDTVEVLSAQESFRMRSFAKANCLVEIEGDSTGLNKGELTNVYLI